MCVNFEPGETGPAAATLPSAGNHQKEIVMEEKEGQSENAGGAGAGQGLAPEVSPSEKLEETPPTGSLVPGPENPESEEIKKEVNPNTE